MTNYYKFVFIRNPLERLLSAYLNKLSKPLDTSFADDALNILQHYRPSLFKKWKEGQIKEITLDYESYLRWIIDTPHHELNEHFAPVSELIQPCRVRFNFYANFNQT